MKWQQRRSTQKAASRKGKLVLSFEDSGAKPETARAIVEKLIDTKKQPLIVGEYTSACAKALQLLPRSARRLTLLLPVLMMT